MAHYLRQNEKLDKIIGQLEMGIDCPEGTDPEVFDYSLTARANDIMAGEYGVDYALARLRDEFPEKAA